MIEIDSADLTNEEREDACAFVRNSGYEPSKICHRFEVRPALPGAVRFDFQHWRYDDNGKWIIEPDDTLACDPVMIYASANVDWLQHYLVRTGRTLDG